MKQEQFAALVTRLEQSAAAQPERYTLTVLGVAALGFCILGLAVGFALATAAAMVGLVLLLITKGGAAMIVIAKLGKLIFLLAIPAWTMVKSSVTLLFCRFPPPEGRELKRDEAPRLFDCLDDLRARMNGPAVHKVLLTDDINAAIVQHPRFGLLGWEQNYLVLGLPLLQVLGEEEALAVVAHEYGHLSGHHSRLGGFIYRFRAAWGRIQELSGQWTDWGSRLIARVFRWYAPYFNAYTFVLARQNEYLADRASAEMVGAQPTANALLRVDMATQFADAYFWPAIQKRVVAEPEPFGTRSAFWEESLGTRLDAARQSEFLAVARRRETDHFNTHPALKDRLAAIGVTPEEAAGRCLARPQCTAAALWLGESFTQVAGELDSLWRQRIDQHWRARHKDLQEKSARLAELESREVLTADEQWERIQAVGELRPDEDLQPDLERLLALDPSHLPARFRRGTLLLLERGDVAGIDDIEAVMAADKGATIAGCEAAWRFFSSRDAEKAKHYAQRGQECNNRLAEVQAESASLPADARLAPADLDPATLSAIVDLLRPHVRHVRRAYLMRRVFRSDANVHDYVLAFETARFTLGDKGPDVVKRLAKLQYPVSLFIVHLGKRPFIIFRKRIKTLGIKPLEF